MIWLSAKWRDVNQPVSLTSPDVQPFPSDMTSRGAAKGLTPPPLSNHTEQKRRKELEIFLNRVAAHGELSSSQYFKTFLQVGRSHRRNHSFPSFSEPITT